MKNATHDQIKSLRLPRSLAPVLSILVMLSLTAGLTFAQGPAMSADLDLVAKGMTHPVAMAEAPDGSGRLFVADQTGQIWIITEDGIRLNEPFLNLADSLVELMPEFDERGLLALAFHPRYADNDRFFVYYSIPLREKGPDNFDHTNRLSEFKVSADDPNVAEPDSEKVLLEVDWPYFNHNGATLAFGPTDSLLYISLGDGGNRDDQDSDLIHGHVEDWYKINAGGNGQDIEDNLLGSILRINVDHQPTGGHGGEQPFEVPEDNPFHDINGVPGEQWAYGFRNPFRMSFDMGGENDLIVGDAGQDLYEEVSVVTKGGNYGWNVMEGTHCFNAAHPTQPFEECPQTVGAGHPHEGDALIEPVIEFRNTSTFEDGVGLVVVGGYVYRGDNLPASFDGQYFFGAWSRGEEETPEGEVHLPGRILVADPQDQGMWPWDELEIANTDSFPHFVLSFGQDLAGNLYALTTDEAGPTGNTGRVYRIVPAGSAASQVPSERIAELPERLALDQNYPNPFNPTTTIRFRVAAAEHVTLKVYDLLGREVAVLVDRFASPGVYSVEWNGRDGAGQSVPSGVYFYRADSESGAASKKMTLLR